MKFAVSAPDVGDVHQLVELAQLAEASGWDGFFLWDHLHLVRNLALEVHDPWVTLGAIAQVTSSVCLGTAITPLPRRRPWTLAKQIVTLDHLSRGRVVIGLGLGAPRSEEFVPFGDVPPDRGVVLDDGLAVLEGLLSGDRFSHRGPVFTITDAHFRPAPVQRPRPPIWMAVMSHDDAPLRRAARYDGMIPIDPEGKPIRPDDVAAMLARAASLGNERRNTPFDFVATVVPGHSIREYEEAGATWVFESTWPEPDWNSAFRAKVAAGPPR